jgi:hypothetical protein
VIGTTTEREFKPVEGLIPTTPFWVEEAMVEPPVSVAMLIELRTCADRPLVLFTPLQKAYSHSPVLPKMTHPAARRFAAIFESRGTMELYNV